MNNNRLFLLLALLLAYLLGFTTAAAWRPKGLRTFYAVCLGLDCEVRASVAGPFKDPVIYRGAAMPPATARGVMGAHDLASALSHLPGWGGHWRP